MDRTQIYLTRVETTALDREARRTGQTRSQLIRKAIDRAYLAAPGGDLLEVLRETAGSWKGRRETGAAHAERLRRGRPLRAR